MSKVSQIIVDTFEVEQPELCKAIKMAVQQHESRVNFDKFLKQVLPDYKTSITYSLSLTVFDHYKQQS